MWGRSRGLPNSRIKEDYKRARRKGLNLIASDIQAMLGSVRVDLTPWMMYTPMEAYTCPQVSLQGFKHFAGISLDPKSIQFILALSACSEQGASLGSCSCCSHKLPAMRQHTKIRAESPRQGRLFALAGRVLAWLLFA